MLIKYSCLFAILTLKLTFIMLIMLDNSWFSDFMQRSSCQRGASQAIRGARIPKNWIAWRCSEIQTPRWWLAEVFVPNPGRNQGRYQVLPIIGQIRGRPGLALLIRTPISCINSPVNCPVHCGHSVRSRAYRNKPISCYQTFMGVHLASCKTFVGSQTRKTRLVYK